MISHRTAKVLCRLIYMTVSYCLHEIKNDFLKSILMPVNLKL